MTQDHAEHLPFDLVVLDLDGTILDLYKSGEVSPNVRRAISAVQTAGIPISIGTGRTLDYVRTQVVKLGITTPVITTQGAVIGDPITGRVVAETLLPLLPSRQVARWVDASAHVAAFYFTDAAGHARIFQNWPAGNAQDRDFYDHVFGVPRTVQPRFEDLWAMPDARPPIKFIIDNDPAREEDILPELRSRFGSELYITRTHPRLVEGTAQGIDKGYGLLRLCELLHIEPRRVLAIGDNDNDIPLLQAAGCGVAMGNATPGVKAVADWVAPTIDEDGAAVALQKLILDQLAMQ